MDNVSERGRHMCLSKRKLTLRVKSYYWDNNQKDKR